MKKYKPFTSYEAGALSYAKRLGKKKGKVWLEKAHPEIFNKLKRYL